MDSYHRQQQTLAYVKQQEIEGPQPTIEGDVPDLSNFETFLNERKDIPLEDFEATFSANKYVENFTFAPMEAKYSDVIFDNSKRKPGHYGPKTDVAFSPAQIKAFKQNGFVVGPEEHSWGVSYYYIYNNDLPVLITVDSILHAFRIIKLKDKSYDAVLEEFEIDYCSSALKTMFNGMRVAIKDLSGKFTTLPLSQCFEDADKFITTATNLLNGEEFYVAGSPQDPNLKPKTKTEQFWWNIPPVPKEKELIFPVLGGDVHDTIKQCIKAEGLELVKMFRQEKEIDFSMFKPRGHYAKSAQLRQYFRAVNWLGQIDLVVAGKGSNKEQLGTAIVLHMLLTHDKQIEETYHNYNKAIEALVGHSDSMDMTNLVLISHAGVLLNEVFKMKSYEPLNSNEALETLQQTIIETKVGLKRYNNALGNTFAFFGKKFAIDGWAQSKVASDIDYKMFFKQKRVFRNYSSSVEVAYAVLANNDTAPIIIDRMKNPSPNHKFRDGLMYHPYLMSVRETVDQLPEEEWSASVYTYWLSALRKLSIPRDQRFPQVMRSKAYAMKNINTQLASWAQLRHDNVLYVQQPVRCGSECDYPVGYVEPMVEFWNALVKLCLVTSKVMKEFIPVVAADDKNSKRKIDNRVEFFLNFAKTVTILRDISTLELENQPLSQQQTNFLKSVVERHETFGSGASTSWLGWYPHLFYENRENCLDPDLIVCDTFTNCPRDDMPDPGCVVHQAIGFPRRMAMVVDSGKDLTAYVGPVFGYYEFELPGIQRMADEEWKEKLKAKNSPPFPEWTNSYLIPN